MKAKQVFKKYLHAARSTLTKLKSVQGVHAGEIQVTLAAQDFGIRLTDLTASLRSKSWTLEGRIKLRVRTRYLYKLDDCT